MESVATSVAAAEPSTAPARRPAGAPGEGLENVPGFVAALGDNVTEGVALGVILAVGVSLAVGTGGTKHCVKFREGVVPGAHGMQAGEPGSMATEPAAQGAQEESEGAPEGELVPAGQGGQSL